MTDRTVRLVISGSSAGAIAALQEVGIQAEVAGAKTEAAFGDNLAGAAERTGGVFQKLGSIAGGLGLPFSESLSTIGEKTAEADAHGQGLIGTLAQVGKVALVAGAAGLAVVAGESLKLGENFQKSTAQLAATAGIPVSAAQKIGNAFLDTAGKSTFSGQEIMAAYAPVSAQLASIQGKALDNKQAMTVMSAAMDLAEASGTSLGSTTSSLAAVMQAYHLGVGQAADASDVLYNVSRLTNTPISALSTVVDRLKGRLGELAPSLQDVGTLMAFPAVAAQGSRGAMVVNTALQTLIGGSKATTAELSSLGVHIFDASGKFVGMQSVIAQLGPKLAGMTQQQQAAAEKTLFGASAAQLMGQVMQGGVAAYDRASQAVTKTGTAQAGAETQAKTLHGEMETMKSTVEDLGTKFGLILIPVLAQVGRIVAQVTNFLMQHKAIAMVLAGVIGGVLLAATVAWTVSLFTAGGALAFLMSPITLVVAAIALLVVGIIALVTHWTEVWQFVKKYSVEIAAGIALLLGPVGLVLAAVLLLATHWQAVFAAMKAVVFDCWHFIDGDFVQPVEAFFTAIPNFIKNHWQLILAILTGPIGLAVSWIVGHFQQVLDFFTGIPGKMASVAAHMWDWISNAFRVAIDTIIGWWNDFVGLLKIPGFSIGIGPIHYKFGGLDFGKGLQIPLLDTGGLVTGPTIAALSGNNVPEIVSPVPQLRQVIAEAIGGGSQGGGGPVQLVIDGRTLGQVLAPYLRTALLQGASRNAVRVGLS